MAACTDQMRQYGWRRVYEPGSESGFEDDGTVESAGVSRQS